jgi:ubiquinone/menaquinone biosynthesis C-methylase UbiE
MHISQKETFLETEGNAWFKRNLQANKDIENDPILSLRQLDLTDKKILEIGTGTGWRLNSLHEKYTCDCYGIDPSKDAIELGKIMFSNINLSVGSADVLPYEDNQFDVIIYGFCLYLCDRNDLFQIASEANRVLKENGHIIIYDFCTPQPYKNPYSHFEGLYSYKMDYSKIFTWNPSYSLIYHNIMQHPGNVSNVDSLIALSLLKKDSLNAYPESPF